MKILKNIWNFLFGSKKEEPIVLEKEEVKEVPTHCGTHIRFRKNCLDCLRAVGAM